MCNPLKWEKDVRHLLTEGLLRVTDVQQSWRLKLVIVSQIAVKNRNTSTGITRAPDSLISVSEKGREDS